MKCRSLEFPLNSLFVSSLFLYNSFDLQQKDFFNQIIRNPFNDITSIQGHENCFMGVGTTYAYLSINIMAPEVNDEYLIEVVIRVDGSYSCRVNVRIMSIFVNPNSTRIINVLTFANPNSTHLLFVLSMLTRI